MKKVLLSSVAALALFAAAAPALAQGENPNSSNAYNQKTYVSWRDAATEANTQVAAHAAEIKEEAEKQPAVEVAATALAKAKGIVGHEHEAEVAKAQAAYDAALKAATDTVRNRYVQVIEERLIAAAKAEGRYYDESGVEANRTNEQRIADDIAAQGKGGNSEAKANENKGGDAAKAGKAGSKQAGKALPKTSAVK